MASYQSRRRAPLLDRSTQAMVERRGRELFGLTLIGAALLVAMVLSSYSPDDPGWMVATDEPARNALGRAGAAVASSLVIITGVGAWGLAVILGGWGVRFVLHQGQERALGRLLFAALA
ncbi:MAG: DNA translocase FtsK 4TM domain-containing protein, partial [Gemmobacter sp.]